MKQHLGEGNYHYLVGIGDPGFGDEPEDDEDEYDGDITSKWNLPIDHLDMADIVKAKPITGVKYISMAMGLGLDKLKDESEIRRQYVDYILKHPDDLLSRLPKDEMDILLYIFANRDKAKGVPTANVEKELMMEIACVAAGYWPTTWPTSPAGH